MTENKTPEIQSLVMKLNELNKVYIQYNNTTVLINDFVLNDLEWLRELVNFTKSFVDFTLKMNAMALHETDKHAIIECPMVLKYKDSIKSRYQKLIYLLKGIYKNALKLPDAEKIHQTLVKDFNDYNPLYLTNPEFIFDYFVYHLHDCVQINKHYTDVLNGLKLFEYFYYKLLNYIKELEFDIETTNI
jgi:hypothetical protein